MNIKSCFKRVLADLDTVLLENRKQISIDDIIELIIETWFDLRVFYKKIDSESTAYYDSLIGSIVIDDIVITGSMIEGAERTIKFLKRNLDNVTQFMDDYLFLVSLILIYNTGDEECCDICQGILFYYFDEASSSIVKECSTCRSLFNAENNSIIHHSSEATSKLRMATKRELSNMLKLNLK